MHCATINKYTFIYLFPYGLFDVQVKVIFLNIIYEQHSIAACPNPPTEHIRSYTRDLQAAQWRRHTVVPEWGHVMDSREHINEILQMQGVCQADETTRSYVYSKIIHELEIDE